MRFICRRCGERIDLTRNTDVFAIPREDDFFCQNCGRVSREDVHIISEIPDIIGEIPVYEPEPEPPVYSNGGIVLSEDFLHSFHRTATLTATPISDDLVIPSVTVSSTVSQLCNEYSRLWECTDEEEAKMVYRYCNGKLNEYLKWMQQMEISEEDTIKYYKKFWTEEKKKIENRTRKEDNRRIRKLFGRAGRKAKKNGH